MSIRRSHYIDIPVIRKFKEHRTRMTSLHEPNPFAIQLLLMSSLKSSKQLSIMDETITNANDTIITMINEISEYSIFRTSSKNLRILLSSLSCYSFSISRENSKEYRRSNLLISVINMLKTTILSPITISSLSRISEDHSLERITVRSNISSVGHIDDIFRLDSSLNQIIISTARIRSNRVVTPTISSTKDHSILLSSSNSCNESKNHERSSHICLLI